MGENYLHEQVQNAKKRRDRSREDLEQPRLFSRPDIIDVVYDVAPTGGERLEEGEELRAIASRKGEEIDLVRSNRKVGVIAGDGAKKLHCELSKPENGGIIKVRLSNISHLSGGADARIVQG